MERKKTYCNVPAGQKLYKIKLKKLYQKFCLIFCSNFCRISRAAVIFSLVFFACEKNVRYSAFDGFWQVMSVEDRVTALTTDPLGRLYISFECELAKLSYFTEDHNTGFVGFEYIGAFTLDGDSLRFTSFHPYRYTNPDETGDAPSAHLAAFGIHRQPAAFALSMTRTTMTLTNTDARLTLRKY